MARKKNYKTPTLDKGLAKKLGLGASIPDETYGATGRERKPRGKKINRPLLGIVK